MLGTASPPAACCPCAPSTSIGVGFRAASSARLRTRARSPQTHQAAAIRKTQRGSRHLTIGHLVERVVVRIARSSLPVEELELVAPLADHCYAHAVRALPPAQTTLLRSCQLSDSSRCFVRPAGFGVHWSSCRRFATMAEPSGGSRARATRCSAASSGTMYRVASGATRIASFAWDIGRRDARSLGTNDGYVLRLGQMQKDRNDSFYNLPPPNSLNRRGVAILTRGTTRSGFFAAMKRAATRSYLESELSAKLHMKEGAFFLLTNLTRYMIYARIGVFIHTQHDPRRTLPMVPPRPSPVYSRSSDE